MSTIVRGLWSGGHSCLALLLGPTEDSQEAGTYGALRIL